MRTLSIARAGCRSASSAPGRRLAGAAPTFALAAAVASLVGCTEDGTNLTTTTTRTVLVGDAAATTLTATANRVVGSDGDHESFPRRGLDVAAGPSPGEQRALVEREPGVYQATLDGAAAAYHYRLEGRDHVHDAPPRFTATAMVTSASPREVLVTWTPPVEPGLGAEETVRVEVIGPAGGATAFPCGGGLTVLADQPDRVTLQPCALPDPGRYRLVVERSLRVHAGEDDGDFVYTWATLAVVRELDVDVP